MKSFILNKENHSFFKFWLAQLISQFGDRVHQMALVGLIATRSPGSSLELAEALIVYHHPCIYHRPHCWLLLTVGTDDARYLSVISSVASLSWQSPSM